MKINSRLGYHPVPFSELTQDDQFWMVAKVVSIILFYKAKAEKLSLHRNVVCSPKKKKERFKLLFE